MTAAARLARLEGALSPKAATLLWLSEAHAYRSLEAYVDWLIDQPLSAAPLERVPGQARAAVLATMRGQPREAVLEAAQRAIRDAIFLVELVLALNGAAVELRKTEGLHYLVLHWQMHALSAEASLAGAGCSGQAKATAVARWRTWCADVTALVTGLHTTEQARIELERRYLDGHPALFPDAIEDMTRLREGVDRLVEAGDVLGPLIQGRAALSRRRKGKRDALHAEVRRQTPVFAARLVDDARLATLDVLGDGAAASAIVARRFRAGMETEA